MKPLPLILLFVCLISALPRDITNHKDVADKHGRIINGKEASEGQFPWQVGIYLKALADDFYCGGAIISDEWVLTAGHCVPGINTYKVVAGVTNLKDTETRVEMYSSEYYRPFDYNSFTLHYDLALIKLPEPLVFNDNIKAIKLTESDPEEGAQVTLSGWGYTREDIQIVNNDLLYTSLNVISRDDCGEYFEDVKTYEGAFCAMYKDNLTNPCNGDSGGALVLNADTDPVQVGIVSFGTNKGCLAEYPTGYTRVTYFRDWIKNITGF